MKIAKQNEVERTLTRYNRFLGDLMQRLEDNETEAFEKTRNYLQSRGFYRQAWVWFDERGSPSYVAEEPFNIPYDREGEWVLMGVDK